MKFKDLSICDKMDWACRYLLIHSFLYYEFDVNLISDSDYDKKLKWLCDYSKKHIDDINKCQYKDVLLNLDPSTGFDMKNYVEPKHYEYIKSIAKHIYYLWHDAENYAKIKIK